VPKADQSKKKNRKTKLLKSKEEVSIGGSPTRPMSDRELDFLRVLKKERTRLQAELRHQQVHLQDHPATGNHMADDATEVEEQAKSIALRSHLEGMAKEIDRAMERIDKGTFGTCETCGKPIGDERLAAMPWVTMCIEHAKAAQSPRIKAAAQR
jgi:RNA polymerase-binding protein DksA